MKCILLFLALIIGVVLASTRLVSPHRTLILHDDGFLYSDYSEMITFLEKRGHIVSYTNPFKEPIQLKHLDHYLIDNLIVLCPRAQESSQGHFTRAALTDFIDHGGSFIVAPSPSGYISPFLASLAQDYGVEYLPHNTLLRDEYNEIRLSIDNVTSPYFIPITVGPTDSRIYGQSDTSRTVIMHGLPMLSVRNVPYVKSLFTGHPTTMAYRGSTLLTTGIDISLLSVVQLENSSRLVFLSSLSLLNNQGLSIYNPYTNILYDNKSIFMNILNWAVHGQGLLRQSYTTHYKLHSIYQTLETSSLYPILQQLSSSSNTNTTSTTTITPTYNDALQYIPLNPSTYTMGDYIHMNTVFEEYNSIDHIWKPIPLTMVAYELTLLDPRTRVMLNSTSLSNIPQSSSIYQRLFIPSIKPLSEQYNNDNKNITYQDYIDSSIYIETQIPDLMGVYKVKFIPDSPLNINDSRGYGLIDNKPLIIPIHPPLHNQIERFMYASSPYYVAFILSIILCPIAIFLMLFGRFNDDVKVSSNKKD